MTVDGNAIRRVCEMRIRPMKEEFDNVKSDLVAIAKNVYPLGLRGLEKEVEDFTHRAESEKADEIVSMVPLEALRKGAAGFLSNLMSPAQKWFHLEENRFKTEESAADVQEAEAEYLERLADYVADIMAKSGSYRAFKKAFEHLLANGFACVVVKEDAEKVCKAECLRPGTYTFGVGADGKVNRVERRFAMNAEEIVREFGGGSGGRAGLPDEVLTAWRNGDRSAKENWVVENLIEPNDVTYLPGTDDVVEYGIPKSYRYRSVYWLRGKTATGSYPGVLRVDGFRFNPIVAPRLDAELGEIYGRGRGHDALNSCRALQALMYDVLEVSSNRAEPPVIAANELREEGLNLGRGGVTYANIGEQRSQMVIPALPNPPTSDETKQAIMMFEQQIKAAFFVDEFATIDSLKNLNGGKGGQKTATEIDALQRENMLLLAGIILMLDDEFLDPVVNVFTAYALRSKTGRALAGGMTSGQLTPKYISNLHRAQRTQEVTAMESAIGFALQIAGAGFPEVMDNYDPDRLIRTRHRLLGAGELNLRKTAEIEKVRSDRQKAQAEAADMQRAQAERQMQLDEAKAMAQIGRARQSEVNAQVLGGEAPAQLGGY